MPQSQENVEIVRRVYEQWARGDFSGTDFLDPDVVYSRIGTETPGLERVWRGLEAMSEERVFPRVLGPSHGGRADHRPRRRHGPRAVPPDRSRKAELRAVRARARRADHAVERQDRDDRRVLA